MINFYKYNSNGFNLSFLKQLLMFLIQSGLWHAAANETCKSVGQSWTKHSNYQWKNVFLSAFRSPVSLCVSTRTRDMHNQETFIIIIIIISSSSSNHVPFILIAFYLYFFFVAVLLFQLPLFLSAQLVTADVSSPLSQDLFEVSVC